MTPCWPPPQGHNDVSTATFVSLQQEIHTFQVRLLPASISASIINIMLIDHTNKNIFC